MHSFTHMYTCVCMLYGCFYSSEELWLVQLLVVQNLLQQNLFLRMEMSPLACEEQCQAPVWSPSLFAKEHFGQDSGLSFLTKGREGVCYLCVPFGMQSSCVCTLKSFDLMPPVSVDFNRDTFVWRWSGPASALPRLASAIRAHWCWFIFQGRSFSTHNH